MIALGVGAWIGIGVTAVILVLLVVTMIESGRSY